MPIILGIDPGLSGGLAIVAGAGLGANAPPRVLDCMSIPCVGEDAKRRVAVLEVISFIQNNPPDEAFIERAQAMPDQGSSSGFIYGRAVGALETCVVGLGIPLRVIESSMWKKAFDLRGRDDAGVKLSTSQVKENSRQRAFDLFPDAGAWIARKKDHNRAESMLIAEYGRRLILDPPAEKKKKRAA